MLGAVQQPGDTMMDLGSVHFPVFIPVGGLLHLALTLIIQEAGAAPGNVPSDD